MKSYIVVFNDAFCSRDKLTEFFTNSSEIAYWYTCFANTVFFTSTLSAKQLGEKVEKHFGYSSGKRFLIAELTTNKQGRLPAQGWNVFSNPDSPRLPAK